LKGVLEILPIDLDAHKCILVFEISHDGFSYAIKDDDTNTYVAIAVFHFVKSTGDDDNSVILQNELLQQSFLSGNFKKVYVMYSFGESVLIPFSLYSSPANANVLNLIHGDFQSNVSVITDIIPEKGVYNSYRVLTPLLNVIRSKFPAAATWHQYSVLLKQVPAEEDKLLIIFYRKKIVIMLNKNGRVQFINTFSYNSTDDVMYILLNTCYQFEVENIPVEISGMIEKDAPLSKEILKYYSSVSFTKLPPHRNYAEEITKHPSHLFSYIFAIDSCE
jgi:Protein of unknown function (DUF3822)